jgi:hypothetical protein
MAMKFRSLAAAEIHDHFFEVLRSAMGLLGSLSLGKRRPDREAIHLSVSNSIVKNEWNCMSVPQRAVLSSKLRSIPCLSSSSSCV